MCIAKRGRKFTTLSLASGTRADAEEVFCIAHYRLAALRDLYLVGYALCRRPLTIAHCSKLAESWHYHRHILHLWCLNLSLGMLSASILASWETLGRSWDTREHKKGHFESRLRFLLIFDNNIRAPI